jgi:hypothetical protein
MPYAREASVPENPGFADRFRSWARHSPMQSVLRRRPFQVYGVGAPKSGTTSLAALFRSHRGCVHEPLAAGTMEAVLAAHRGELDAETIRAYLRWRDRELWLSLESSHLLAVFVPHLTEIFPAARFILTWREPRAWLRSIVAQQLSSRERRERTGRIGPRAGFFRDLHDLCCGERGAGGPGEEPLTELDLYSLDGYLGWWARHNQAILDAVPEDRLLVVRTEDIQSRATRIERFSGAMAGSLDVASGHANQGSRRFDVLERVDPSVLSRKLEERCQPILDRLLTTRSGC